MIRQYDYKHLAKYYDKIELEDAEADMRNKFVKKVLDRRGARKVLDITAGTGSQAVFLARYFDVTANDINKEMLEIARQKAKEQHLRIRFSVGDMRTVKLGRFDAVISIFNAIGHLSKEGFSEAIRNINASLEEGGIYIFDIFNAEYMNKNFKDYLFIDAAGEFEGVKFVRFNKNSYDRKNRIMRIHQRLYLQKPKGSVDVFRENWDMQIYSLDELKKILQENGFVAAEVYGGMDGASFSRGKSNSVVIVAQKKRP